MDALTGANGPMGVQQARWSLLKHGNMCNLTVSWVTRLTVPCCFEEMVNEFVDRLTSAYLGLYFKVMNARSSCVLIHAKIPERG